MGQKQKTRVEVTAEVQVRGVDWTRAGSGGYSVKGGGICWWFLLGERATGGEHSASQT